MGVIDRFIEALAASQYGVFATWQLVQYGIDSRSLIARERDGQLRRLYRGVYATGPYLSFYGHWMAATLAAWRRDAAASRAAGSAHDLVKWRGGSIDVTVPTGGRKRKGLRVHESRGLQPQDRTLVEGPHAGILLARTLLDLAAILQPLELQRAYESTQARG